MGGRGRVIFAGDTGADLMRGHDQVIALRLRGRKPGIVFVNDYQCRTDWLENNDHATICVDGDVPELLDLRCLHGLRVSISASSIARGKRLMDACKCAGCITVAAGASQDRGGWFESIWSDVWHQEEIEVAHG